MTAAAGARTGRLPAAGAILLITLLTYYFPGHTYLQQDTQIYVPMLEHIEDPTVLACDLSAVRPHLTFTLYDEITIELRRLTGASYQNVLMAQQFVFRAAGTLGLFLLALSLPLPPVMAMLAAAWCSLGATIVGPAVLSIEYEPVPRGFAVALVLLASGLLARQQPVRAASACGLAFLYHAPTAIPLMLLLGIFIVWRHEYRALIPLAVAVLVLSMAAWSQIGQTEHQTLLGRIDPALEQLQRIRTAYDRVSQWDPIVLWQYPLLWGISILACFRLRLASVEARWILIGLPLLGLLAIPGSYVTLDLLEWDLIPQFQPARAVLFIVVFAVLLSAAAAIRARRAIESAAWLLIVFSVPLHAKLLEFFSPGLADPTIRRATLLTVALALTTAILLSHRARTWGFPALAALAVGCFFLIPGLGGIRNYAPLGGPALDSLAQFARESTPKDAVFLFPDAGKDHTPGAFRALAQRCVYVDWKAGGQVNYYRSVGLEWWRRWEATMANGFRDDDMARYRQLGIGYAVLNAPHRIAGGPPAYQNAGFTVYRLDGR